ncbi:MAG: aminotransferase class III-fold pyridoxal phosphate-dependent enzyme [Alcaligenaceae bacterium]|nr:aminotransferase class III-fold pyridoxal phosphate-dependent enzyme [Alcaligenaceae bacterium]
MTSSEIKVADPSHAGAQVLSQAEQDLRAIASRVLPAGSFGNLPFQTVVTKGRGGRVWDESGNEYIDYLLGSGPMLIGHAHPDVTAAVQAQVVDGTTFFSNNRHGILLAEAIVQAVPCAEKVRFVSSGTEADFYAMRLARAFRKRDKILKFEGGYHGMSDYGLMSLAPKREGHFPEPIPDSPGIPQSVRDEVIVAPFNDAKMAVDMIRKYHDELGGVIVEPFQRLLAPVPGFLEALREVTAEYGIPLIFDEVVTGFRFAYGGAQEYFGVTPDICTLGKACGGGFPLAAIAGRADIMALFDPASAADDRFLMQIGTLNGNPVAAAAGLATLNVLQQPKAYENYFAIGQALIDSLSEQLKQAGLPGQVVGAPPMFDVIFHQDPVRNYRDTISGDPWLTQRFNVLLRERGIFKGDTKYYVSMAHDAADIQFTQEAWQSAIEQLLHERKAQKV